MTTQEKRKCPWCNSASLSMSEDVVPYHPYPIVYATVCGICGARGPESLTKFEARESWERVPK